MSPAKDADMDAPAFSVYNKNKKRRNRSKKTSRTNDEEIIVTEESDIEEISANPDEPCSSKTMQSKNNRMSSSPFTPKTKRNHSARDVEVIDVDMDENSSELENTQKKKKKRNIDDTSLSDDEIVVEHMTSGSGNKVTQKAKEHRESRNNLSISDMFQSGHSGNSIEEGKKIFSWIIQPIDIDDFMKNTWEKRPLHIKRTRQKYYKPLLTTADIDKMLRNNNVQFTKNLDVTSYTNGKRETHNPDGRAQASIVWDFYENGCSVRLLNPQTFIPKILLLNSTLQDYFGCFVGANVYLTPPNSQGFAPHYDDIEAFVLQVEGQKHWKLYSPLSKDEILPRFSSRNFQEGEIGKPILEVTLNPGDMLYFPRGVIHQAQTVPGRHSLHITVSCYQRNSWADLMEKAMVGALRSAIEEDLDFRKGLPRDYLEYMGVVHSEEESSKRNEFIDKIKSLAARLLDHIPFDAAADQMGKQFMHDALPPVLNAEEKMCTALADGIKMGNNGKITEGGRITLDTRVKLLRAHILRVVTEEDVVRVYHYADNSLEYHGGEPQYLEITAQLAIAVEQLIQSYPEFVTVSELQLNTDEQKVMIVGDLWDRGLLLTDGPLPTGIDDPDPEPEPEAEAEADPEQEPEPVSTRWYPRKGLAD